jgi:hypothetical protein
LNHHSWRTEIAFFNSNFAETKLRQGSQDPVRIVGRGTHQQIEIRGIARVPVESDGERANHQILNFVRVQ